MTFVSFGEDWLSFFCLCFCIGSVLILFFNDFTFPQYWCLVHLSSSVECYVIFLLQWSAMVSPLLELYFV